MSLSILSIQQFRTFVFILLSDFPFSFQFSFIRIDQNHPFLLYLAGKKIIYEMLYSLIKNRKQKKTIHSEK